MAAIQYARLYPDTTQLQAKDGHNLTAGWVMVFLAGTDDPATTYADFNGTVNPQKIVIDDNGRFCAIVDKAKAYRVEVYDSEGMLQWTTEPVWCTGNAGSGMSVTKVISSDGSISVEENIAGTERTYDIGIAPDNVRELLEWAKCYNTVEEDGVVYPLFAEGTMQTFVGQGLEVVQDRFYHLTNKITVIPSGNGINYETLTVQLVHDDGQGTTIALCTHDFDIDNSVSDKVEMEFSEDILPNADGFLFWRVTNATPFANVSLDLQIHRIFSGINAVPQSIASRTWVEESISSKIDYSALEYNPQNLITGISGSAIAANNVDPSVFIPWSASGTFQPSGSYVSSTDMSAYVPFSSIEGVSGQVTAINQSAIRGHEYEGVYPIGVDNTADKISIDTLGFGVDNVTITATADENGMVIGVANNLYQPSGDYLSATESSKFQLTADMSAYQLSGDYAYNSAVSAKLDTSAYATASGTFLTAVPDEYATEAYVDSAVSSKLDVTASSQFITSLPADLATTGDVASAVSGKMDKSASGEFYPMSGNPSGFLTAHQSLAGYATEQYVDSSVSGKLDTSAYDSAQFLQTSQSGMFQPSGQYLSATESSNYYSTSNPSGFLTGVDLSPYQLTADMSAYQLSGNYLSSTDSAEFILTSQSGMFQPSGEYQPSGNYLSATESANYYPTSNPSGFISGVDLTPYQLTADMSSYYTTANESGFVDSAYVEEQVSGKQDASAMTAYQEVSGMTAYQPSGDYIYVSALGWAEV